MPRVPTPTWPPSMPAARAARVRLDRTEQFSVRRPAAAADPRVRRAGGDGQGRSGRLAGRAADVAGGRDPRGGAARGRRPGVDGQRDHQPAVLRHARLEPVRRIGEPGRDDPAPRPGRHLRPDGLREPRSLPAVARGARRWHRRRAGARRATERRGGAPLRRTAAQRAGRARRLLPDRPGPRLSRGAALIQAAAGAPAEALPVPASDAALPAARRGGDRRCSCWLPPGTRRRTGGSTAAIVAAALLALLPATDLATAAVQRLVAQTEPAAPAAAARSRARHPRRRPDDGDRPDPVRQRRRGRGTARASRGARPGQSRPATALRAAQRLHRRRCPAPARRPGDPGRGPRGHRGTQCPARPREAGSLLPVPSRSLVERQGIALDGLGAQARQDRGVQPAPARRHRHQLPSRRRRPVRAALGALLPDARQRHAPAARRGA